LPPDNREQHLHDLTGGRPPRQEKFPFPYPPSGCVAPLRPTAGKSARFGPPDAFATDHLRATNHSGVMVRIPDAGKSFTSLQESVLMLRKLWMDECGALISAELVLVGTILMIGMAVGLSALRNAIVTELGDVGAAIAATNQSFQVGGLTGHHAQSSAQEFNDLGDSCDDGTTQTNLNSRCIQVCESGDPEEGDIIEK
jgi:hypothetical protein